MAAKVTGVERFILQVPFVERVRVEMERAGIHTWSELEITRVETDGGVVGWWRFSSCGFRRPWESMTA